MENKWKNVENGKVSFGALIPACLGGRPRIFFFSHVKSDSGVVPGFFYLCMCACMYVCMYACMYVCMRACMYVYMHISTLETLLYTKQNVLGVVIGANKCARRAFSG